MLHKAKGLAPTAITLRIGTPQTLSKRGESQFTGTLEIMPMSMMRRIQPEVEGYALPSGKATRDPENIKSGSTDVAIPIAPPPGMSRQAVRD